MTDYLIDHQLCAHELPAKRDKDNKHCYEQAIAVYISLENLLEAADIVEDVLGKLG